MPLNKIKLTNPRHYPPRRARSKPQP